MSSGGKGKSFVKLPPTSLINFCTELSIESFAAGVQAINDTAPCLPPSRSKTALSIKAPGCPVWNQFEGQTPSGEPFVSDLRVKISSHWIISCRQLQG